MAPHRHGLKDKKVFTIREPVLSTITREDELRLRPLRLVLLQVLDILRRRRRRRRRAGPDVTKLFTAST
jgi:hypothetical protein